MRYLGNVLLFGVLLSAFVFMTTQEVRADKKDAAKECSLEELKAAPEELEIAGRKIKLETSLWINLQPGIVGDTSKRGVGGSITLQTTDGKAFPKGIQVKSVWLINGDKLGTLTPKEEAKRKEGSPSLEILARDGPSWESKIKIIVVVLLKDEKGNTHLLRATDQEIKAAV